MSASVHVILNPTAGGGSAARLRGEVERELRARRVDFTLRETEARGHAQVLAREAAEQGARAVVAVGGDGTIHEVANGLLRAREHGARETALGIVAHGTGNDFAKVVEGSAKRPRAYDIIAAGHATPYDVGYVEWEGDSEYFVNGMGTGIDVEVVRQIERLPHLPGVVGYLVGLIRALIGFRPVRIRVCLDGEVVERRVLLAVVGNGPCLGGGFYLCPAARPRDGRFDVCIIRDLTPFQIVRTMSRVLRGTHPGLPGVETRQVTRIEMKMMDDTPLFFQLDGELRESRHARRLRITLRPAALPVLTLPAGGAS